MRVLASADMHGKWPVYDWLLNVASENQIDAFALGDLLDCPDGFNTPEEAQQHEAQILTELLVSAGMPVLYMTPLRLRHPKKEDQSP